MKKNGSLTRPLVVAVLAMSASYGLATLVDMAPAWQLSDELSFVEGLKSVVLLAPIAAILLYIFMLALAFTTYGYELQLWRGVVAATKIIDSLSNCLDVLEGNGSKEYLEQPEEWSTYFHKNLNYASLLLRRRLPVRLPSVPYVQRRDFEEHCGRAADSIDSMHLLLLMPNLDAENQLRRRLAETIAILALGSIRDLPLEDVSSVRRESMVHKSLNVARRLLVGVVPGVVVLTIHLADVPLNDQFKGWATFGAVIWGLMSILIIVDPQAKEKMSLGEGVVSILRGARDSGGSRS